MKQMLDEFVAHLPGKAVAFLNTILAIGTTLTLGDWLDLSQKIVAFIITVIVGALSARHYVLKNRNLEREIELKDQELYKAMIDTKLRQNGKHNDN